MSHYHSRLNSLMSKTTPSTTYFFTQSEHEILRSLSAYMVGIPRDAALEVPIITIDAFVKQLPKTLQTQLRFGLHLFQWAPPPLYRENASIYATRLAGCGEIY